MTTGRVPSDLKMQWKECINQHFNVWCLLLGFFVIFFFNSYERYIFFLSFLFLLFCLFLNIHNNFSLCFDVYQTEKQVSSGLCHTIECLDIYRAEGPEKCFLCYWHKAQKYQPHTWVPLEQGWIVFWDRIAQLERPHKHWATWAALLRPSVPVHRDCLHRASPSKSGADGANQASPVSVFPPLLNESPCLSKRWTYRLKMNTVISNSIYNANVSLSNWINEENRVTKM